MPATTETLDKVYLEWSQFTDARTSREIEALALLNLLDRNGGLGSRYHDMIRAMIVKLSV